MCQLVFNIGRNHNDYDVRLIVEILKSLQFLTDKTDDIANRMLFLRGFQGI